MTGARARAARIGAGALAAALMAGPAAAYQWSLGGAFSQSVETETNRGFGDDGAIWGGSSSLFLNLGLEADRTVWRLGTTLRGEYFGGAGADDSFSGFRPNVAGGVQHTGTDFQLGGNLGFTRRSTSFIDFDEEFGETADLEFGDELSERNAVENRLSGSGSWSYQVDPRNTASFGAFGAITRFTGETGTVFEDSDAFGGSASWSRLMSPRTTGSLSAGIQSFSADGPDRNESLSGDVSLGFTHLLGPALTVSGSGGVSVTETERTLFDPFGRGFRDSDVAIGGVGSLFVTYRLDDTSLSARYERSISPSREGELQTRDLIGLSFGHDVNRRSRIGLNAAASRRTSVATLDAAGTGTLYSAQISPTYSYVVTQDWRANLGYSLRVSDDDDGTDLSNHFFFTVTRDLAIFP